MITSKHGKVTVLMDKQGHYLLGYIKHPDRRLTGDERREAMQAAHLARCTRSRSEAQAWADKTEGRLKDEQI